MVGQVNWSKPMTTSKKLGLRGSNAIQERAINDVGMPSDPSHVCHASKAVSRMHIKDIFHRERSTEEVSTGCMNDTLGFACRSRGLFRCDQSSEGEVKCRKNSRRG